MKKIRIPRNHMEVIREMNRSYLARYNLIPPGKVPETIIKFMPDVYTKKPISDDRLISKISDINVLDVDASESFKEFSEDRFNELVRGKLIKLLKDYFTTIRQVVVYGYGSKSIDDQWIIIRRSGFGLTTLQYIDQWLESLGLRRGMDGKKLPSKNKTYKPSPGDLLGPGHREL